jgi:hypothetical protein
MKNKFQVFVCFLNNYLEFLYFLENGLLQQTNK